MTNENLDHISKKLELTSQRHTASANLSFAGFDTEIPLTYLLTRIFNREPARRFTKTEFEGELARFNQANGCDLRFEDFEAIQWIRQIDAQIVLPHMMWSLIWGHNRGENAHCPVGKELHVKFLAFIQEHVNSEKQFTLTESALTDRINQILPGSASKAIEILRSRGFVQVNESSGTYTFFFQGDHGALVDELAAGLWALSVREHPDLKHFGDYLRRLHLLDVWPRCADKYFSQQDRLQYCKLFREFINFEPDLVNSDNEYRKAVLDCESLRRIDLNNIPSVSLAEADPFSLAQKAEALDGHGTNIYVIQPARRVYALGLHLLLQCDRYSQSRFATVCGLLKGVERPYVVTHLFFDVPRNYPQVIPYLVTDAATIPLAYLALEQIAFRQDLFSAAWYQEEKLEREAGWRQEIRDELLEPTLSFLQRNAGDPAGNALALYRMLDILLRKAFSGPLDTAVKIKQHQLYLKEYKRLFSILSSRTVSMGGQVSFAPFDLRVINEFVTVTTQKPSHVRSEFLQIGDRRFHLLVDVLRLLSDRRDSGFHDAAEKGAIAELEKVIIDYVEEEFRYYFTATQISVARWPQDVPEQLPAKRGVDNPFLDTIDWGFLFLQLASYNRIATISADLRTGFNVFRVAGVTEYSEEVQDASHKIKTYLRVLFLAYIGVAENRDEYSAKGFPVDQTIRQLENELVTLCTEFCRNNLANGQIDVFGDRFRFRINYLYTDDLLSLLFKCINLSRGALGISFVRQFFQESVDLGQLLHAVNALEDPSIRQLISEQINSIDVDKFIDSVYHSELMDSLIYAANSDHHWETFAAPLMKRVEENLSRRSPGQADPDATLFEIRMLLAFKAKDYQQLQDVPFPPMQGLPAGQRRAFHRRKAFFEAAFKMYNDKDYDSAISLLQPISVEMKDNPDPDILVHLFRARTLKALAEKDSQWLVRGYLDWDADFSKVPEDKKPGFQRFAALTSLTKLHYLGLAKDYDGIDGILRELPAPYKFDEEVHGVITMAYKQRGLMIPALEYLNNAADFYESNKIPVPAGISSLKDQVSGEQAVDQLKTAMGILRNIAVKDVPRILPSSVNDRKNLEEFILRELTQACQTMVEKIEGVRFIKGENRYSDVLVAIMRSRFGVWGWTVEDQSRMGSGVKDAGEVDFTIRSTGTGTTITLIEALNYKNDPKGHIKKVRSKYTHALPFYYILTYLPETENLDDAWKDHEGVVSEIDFNAEWGFGGKNEQVLPIENFDCPLNIKVGKTVVGAQVTLFHVMVKMK